MEIAGLRFALGQLRDAFLLAYCAVVAATALPGFGYIPSVIPIPFYLFVPGYLVTVLLRNTSTVIEGFFYSLAWSLAIITAVYSVQTIPTGFQFIPVAVIVPAIAVVLLGCVRLRNRRPGRGLAGP